MKKRLKKHSSDSTRLAEPNQGLTNKVTEGKSAPDPKKILELFGKIDWDDTYDHKAARGRH